MRKYHNTKNRKIRIKRKEGLFFTIDALIAAIVLITSLLLITSSYVSEQPRTVINHASQDLLNVISEIRLGEINNTLIQEMYTNGSITDLNQTVIEQLGEFWANDELQLANSLAQNVTAGILPDTYGYSIVINNETIYTTTKQVTNTLVNSKKILSGIQKAKPIKGFVSKARATSIKKTTNKIISLSPEGSGWDGRDSDKGFVYITKWFKLDQGIQINNATLYVSLHFEDDESDYDVININNGTCIITRDDLNPSEEGYFGIRDVSGCVSPGNNNIVLSLWNDGYNAHIHPGMYLAVNYNTTQNITYITRDKSERFYFDNVKSVEGNGDGSGAWAVLPFHLPPGATDISAKLRLNLQDVNDLKDRRMFHKYRDAYDFRIYINSDSTYYQQNGGDSTDINDCLWDSKACGTEYNYTGTFNITDRLETGTNIVAVYVNCYGDTVGGDGDTIIYSDEINDPDNSSYVELNYSLTPTVPYGVVEIRQTHEFGGSPSPTKDTSFTFPSEAIAISNVFTHIAEQYSYIARVYGDTSDPPNTLVFESPSARAVPTDVYIPESNLDVSELVTNYVRLKETSNNDIRPESTIDYGFYVPSSVGYGNVFNTAEEANNDAMNRLEAIMGNFINISNAVIENASMTDVPSMWGPATIEVRVWN